MRRAPVLLAALSALALPASAHAAQRWAAPGGSGSTCAQAAPCALATAVSGAVAGDVVEVLPGTHSLAAPVVAVAGVDIEGVAARPLVKAPAGLSGAPLTIQGGSLRHLELASETVGDALVVKAGVAEDLVLSAPADVAKVSGSAATTVLREVVLRSGGGATTGVLKTMDRQNQPGDVAVRNVTIFTPGASATAVECDSVLGTSSFVNVIARGGANDIDASKVGSRCTAAWSSFRPLLSPGLVSGPANQSADPRFVAPDAGDLHLQAGSPAVDAGTSDLFLGLRDLDGVARLLGVAPDMGAYEQSGSGAASGGDAAGAERDPAGANDVPARGDDVGALPSGLLSPPGGSPASILAGVAGAPPVLGRSVLLHAVAGRVQVRRPGGDAGEPVGAGVRAPVGAVVDATKGTVLLETSLPGGRFQTAAFRGGRFEVRQPRALAGLVELALRGGDFTACRSAGRAVARAAATRGARTVRRLWGRDNEGRFRTQARTSATTARGTEWLVEDRCDGTRTSVFQGAVDVRHRSLRRTVRVEAGETYLARPVRRRRAHR